MTSHTVSDAAVRGLIFNIQKYSVHDGPGIRTIVFFKGCPLRCRWCSNPESQNLAPELGYNAVKCLACGACVSACPQKALTLTPQGISIDRTVCAQEQTSGPNACQSVCSDGCLDVCPSGALICYGKWRTVGEVLDEVEEDSVFYARSGGGLTLSGGEALSQPPFVLALLREAKQRRIRTALESCLLAPEATVLEAASLLDYLLVDVKCLDSALHKAFTGVGNERILANIKAVRAAYPKLSIHVRTPVIPSFNATEDAIGDIAAFAAELGALRYELLPYHRMGEQKYRFLGQNCAMATKDLNEELFARLERLAEKVCP